MHDSNFYKTETARSIFRNFRFTILKFGIYKYPKQILRSDTHKFCLKYSKLL